jgi:hypothetical protein
MLPFMRCDEKRVLGLLAGRESLSSDGQNQAELENVRREGKPAFFSPGANMKKPAGAMPAGFSYKRPRGAYSCGFMVGKSRTSRIE